MNLVAKVEITPYEHGSNGTYLMKLVSVHIRENTGARPKDPFTRSTKLTQALSDQSAEPVMFQYQSNGSVGDIFAPSGVSGTGISLLRGIIKMLQINIKRTQNVYDLQEPTAGGICDTTYVVPQQNEGDQLLVKKSIDFNKCQDKESKNVGKAFMDYCEPCQRLRRIVRNTATSTIKLKNNVIEQVVSEQNIYYSPLQGHNGSTIMEARQVLTWAGTRSSQSNPPQIQIQNRGNLKIFPDEMCRIPFGLPKTESLEAQVQQIIQQMAQNNQEKIPHNTTVELMQLIPLLGHASPETLHTIWKQFSQKTKQRTWFLQALRMAGSEDSLKFAQQIFHDRELTDREAATLIPIAIHVTRGSPRALQISKELIQDPKVQESPTLYKLTVLSYGSMVSRHCLHLPTCPESALEPLHDLAADALSKVHEEDMTLALKALGNAGQTKSIKRIKKLLPGFSSSAAQLPVRNQVDAVMALRNVATRDPHKVQEILMQVYMDREVDTEVRMMSSMALFETKPGPAMITNITNVAVRESTDKPQLASFVHSQLKALAKRSVPQLEPLAAAGNVSLKMASMTLSETKPRPAMITNIANVAVRERKVNLQLASFVYSQLKALAQSSVPQLEPLAAAGVAAEAYLQNNPTTLFPAAVIIKLRGYLGGSGVDVAEVGLRAEGLTKIVKQQVTESGELPMRKKISQIVKLLGGFRTQPSQSPLISTYFKVFGQEIFNDDKASSQTRTRARREAAESHATVKNITKLLNGMIGQIAQAVEDVVSRHITPSIVGLPVVISLKTTAAGNSPVSCIKVDDHMTSSSSPDLYIAQLLDSLIDEELNASTQSFNASRAAEDLSPGNKHFQSAEDASIMESSSEVGNRKYRGSCQRLMNGDHQHTPGFKPLEVLLCRSHTQRNRCSQ